MTNLSRWPGGTPPRRRFIFRRPTAFRVGLLLGPALGFVFMLALVNGWMGFSLADLFGWLETPVPVPTWFFNAWLSVFTAAWFLGLVVLVPHEVRFDDHGIVLVRLLGERSFAEEEIVGATESPLGHCLVQAGRFVYLLLPLFDEMEELKSELKETVRRRHQTTAGQEPGSTG